MVNEKNSQKIVEILGKQIILQGEREVIQQKKLAALTGDNLGELVKLSREDLGKQKEIMRLDVETCDLQLQEETSEEIKIGLEVFKEKIQAAINAIELAGM